MPEYKSVAELLGSSSKKLYFDHFPTSSKHEATARTILNELLSEHEEWFPCAAAFVVFPIQKWAQQKRIDLCIDLSALSEDSYFGIKTEGRFQNQRVSLIETDKEIELVSMILEETLSVGKKASAVINAIHGIRHNDVSKYMIESYYRKTMTDIFQQFKDEFHIITHTMAEGLNSEPIEGVYHNTDMLIRQMSAIDGMHNRKWDDIQYQHAYNTITECINALDSYWEDGETLRFIADAYAHGVSESQISAALNKSRTFVRARYRTAIEVLSYLIWGYSTREVLQPYLHK